MTPGRSVLLAIALLAVAYMLVAGGPLGGVTIDGQPDDNAANATVTFVDESGTQLGQLSGPIADTWSERRTGLSETDTLGPNEGMIFVYEAEGTRTYVMRDMAFPLDIIFVDGDGRIAEIYQAAATDDPNRAREHLAAAREAAEALAALRQ